MLIQGSSGKKKKKGRALTVEVIGSYKATCSLQVPDSLFQVAHHQLARRIDRGLYVREVHWCIIGRS